LIGGLVTFVTGKRFGIEYIRNNIKKVVIKINSQKHIYNIVNNIKIIDERITELQQ